MCVTINRSTAIRRHGSRPGRLHYRLGRPAGATDEQFFRRPDHGARLCAERFRSARLTPGTTMDNVGGSAYWATTAELQSAIPGIPKEYGLRATAFVDAGSVFRYSGSTAFGSAIQVANDNVVRSSVGAGLTWASPFGALTVDYAVPLSKGCLRRRATSPVQRGWVLTGTECAVANPYNSASRSRHSRNRLEK